MLALGLMLTLTINKMVSLKKSVFVVLFSSISTCIYKSKINQNLSFCLSLYIYIYMCVCCRGQGRMEISEEIPGQARYHQQLCRPTEEFRLYPDNNGSKCWNRKASSKREAMRHQRDASQWTCESSSRVRSKVEI